MFRHLLYSHLQAEPYKVLYTISNVLYQCFSTAAPRPATGPWHQLYRAARGPRNLQYATRFN